MSKVNKREIMKNVSIALQTQRRIAFEVRQPFVAERAGITQQQLSNFELGATLPSLLSLIALADVYDLSLDYLVGRCQNSKAHKTQRLLKYKED